ncbi:putative glycoside hydrolase [Pontiellaceae bacterium B12219]|nr:putative glycoside hydrolase [Pontiellaceae bacterium B12219]
MRGKTVLLTGITALWVFSTQASNFFWNGSGADNNWTNVANWGAAGALPGDNQVDQALVTASTTLSTPATINTSLVFSNSVSFKVRNKSYALIESGGNVDFTAIQIGVNASVGNGSTLTQTGGAISGSTLQIGSAATADYGNRYEISGSGSLLTTADLTIGAGSTFRIIGEQATVNVGDTSGDDLVMTGGGSELAFVLGTSGASVVDIFDTFSIDSANAMLTIDASGLSTNTAAYELVRFSSLDGLFSAGNILITGLADGLNGSIVYDSDSMNLLVSGEADVPPGLPAAKIFQPISGTLKPRAGSASQTDADLICNGADLGSSQLSCIRTISDSDYIYSVSYVQDMDGDGFDDILTFDIRVEGFEGSVYSYSTANGASSMTALGSAAEATDVDNAWGVDDNEMDPGQSLRFSVENIHSTAAGSITYEGFTSIAVKETSGGYDHRMIFGDGTGLDSGSFQTDTAAFAIPAVAADPFVVTGAGSNVANREWAITSIAFSFKGPLVSWDPTDYSSYKIAPNMLDEYEAQTNYANYPDFSWDTVPRWLIVRKAAPAYTAAEVAAMAGNYEVIVWEKANKAGFSTIEEGIIDASSRVKAVDPTMKSLFYRNTSLHYSGYESDTTYDEWNWSRHTTDTNGMEVLDLHKDKYPWYNYDDVADMRDWWVNDAALPMILHESINGVAPIDGVFCDKCLVPTTGYFFDGNGDPVDEYIGTQYRLAQALEVNNKLMVGNVIRNERHNGGREYMRFYDGSYLERWNFPYSDSGQSTADAVCASIQLMREASSKGRMIFFKTGENSAASSMEEMEADMPYHLALYLIVAEEYSYFAYQDTVNALEDDFQWETSWMTEFSRPLGAPLGGPIKDGYVYTRQFAHVDVWVDVANEEAVLAWDSVDSDEDGLDDQWEFRYFGDVTIADPNGNPDGDELVNSEEYLAGTDPNLPESLEISRLAVGESVQLEWDAIDGYLYQVYWSSNLVHGFSLVGSNLVDGLFIDAIADRDVQGFYRISVEKADR